MGYYCCTYACLLWGTESTYLKSKDDYPVICSARSDVWSPFWSCVVLVPTLHTAPCILLVTVLTGSSQSGLPGALGQLC